jgi:hypothetical protein
MTCTIGVLTGMSGEENAKHRKHLQQHKTGAFEAKMKMSNTVSITITICDIHALKCCRIGFGCDLERALPAWTVPVCRQMCNHPDDLRAKGPCQAFHQTTLSKKKCPTPKASVRYCVTSR